MRICVVTGIFPPDIGGPASYVPQLGQSLHSLGHKVEVITYSSGREGPRYAFGLHRISRCIPLPLRLFVTLIRILRTAARSDLIYCNGLMVPCALASVLLAKRLVTKVEGDFAWERASNSGLTSDSIVEFQDRAQSWKAEVLRVVRDLCLKRCRAVITTSEFLARLIRRWGYCGRVAVIYNSVEEDFGQEVVELSRGECRARIGFSGRTVVVSAGRLVLWKGFREVIEAARPLGERVVVLIVGDGPERSNLARLIESSGVEDRVFLVGRVPRRELAIYLRAADCFVLNSGYESFSHVMLEAMKMGTPVVAARSGGMAELVEDGRNGFLFEKDDVGQMVMRVKECLDDSAVRERVTAEASKRLSRYGWSSILSRTVRVLKDAAQRRR